MASTAPRWPRTVGASQVAAYRGGRGATSLRDACRCDNAAAYRSHRIAVPGGNKAFSRYVWLVALSLALLNAPVFAHSPARRLQDAATTSTQCRASMAKMISDTNWIFMNNSQTRWCRVKLENVMARCCTIADFANKRGEGCKEEECEANCEHSGLADLCNSYFGKTCTVVRVPFRGEAAQLKVRESFCLPTDCDNNVDIEALMPWYSTSYKAARGGWHLDYDEAELNCPSDAVKALMYIIIIILSIVALIPILWILCVAPKDRGRTLVTQAEMMENDEADGGGMDASGAPFSPGTTLGANPALAGPGSTQDSFSGQPGQGQLQSFGATQ